MISNNLAVTGHCINLYRSSNNSIHKNRITDDDNGIRLEYWSNFNTIFRNNITDNTQAGVSVERYSNYNTIYQNNISQNGYGFFIEYSTQNTIWNNSILDNDQQVYVSTGSVNNWDGGYSVGGNYWSCYVSPDLFSGPYQNIAGGDGIGDDPYVINANNKDNYPFMLLSICNVSQIPAGEIIPPGEQVRINATMTHLYSVERAILDYTIVNNTGTFSFSLNMSNGEGNIWNATLLSFPLRTNVTYIIIGQDVEGNTISSQQQGYSLNYQVIPEISSTIILAPLAIAILLIAIVSKRKTGKSPKAQRHS
jgi:parallel beta-helix repeat protein